jgi:hypothetical protein
MHGAFRPTRLKPLHLPRIQKAKTLAQSTVNKIIENTFPADIHRGEASKAIPAAKIT